MTKLRICLNCGLRPAKRGSMFCCEECKEKYEEKRYERTNSTD